LQICELVSALRRSNIEKEGVVIVSSQIDDLEGRCLKIGAARWLRQDFSPNGAKSAFGSLYSFFFVWIGLDM
jgi:hypothetical protein